MQPEKENILVIGAGVTGLCAAYYLHKKGFTVTVVDKTGITDGCSWGNAGMIVPSHLMPLASPGMPWMGLRMMLDPEGPFHIKPRLDAGLIRWGLEFIRHSNRHHVERSMPLLLQLNTASLELYRSIREEAFDFGLKTKGLIMYCKTDKTLRSEAAIAERGYPLGLEGEVLKPSELQTIDPGLELDVKGGVYYPGDAFFTPESFMDQLKHHLMDRGVSIRGDWEINGMEIAGNSIKSAVGREKIEADQFVITAGAWSTGLCRSVGIKLPLQAGKGYSFTLPEPARIPEICSILVEARIAVTPMGGDLRFGGTMEIGGLNDSVSWKRLQGMRKAIPEYFPQFSSQDFADLDVWTGLRPCSPDGLPYLGRSKKYSNLIIATGNAMMGMSLGPVTGKIISQIAAEEETEVVLDLMKPERFD